MDYIHNPIRGLLIQQINQVDSLAKVREAQTALREWRQNHPEDWSILDVGEELSLLADAYLEDDSPPGKSPKWTEWQRLEYGGMGARTLPAISAARHVLRQWVEHHPNETEPDLLEALFLLLNVVEDEQTGQRRVEVLQEREPAGQAA